MTPIQLPPLLPYPGDDAPDDVMKRYTDRAWLHRQVEREDELYADLLAHRRILETAANKQAAAAESQAKGTNALADYDMSAEARHRTSLIVKSAVEIFIDRTSEFTGDPVLPSKITSSVRDAVALVNASLAASKLP